MLLNDFFEKHLDSGYPAFEDEVPALEVLEMMENGRYESLPVLREGKPYAVVTVQDLLQARHLDESETLTLRELPLARVEKAYAEENLFDVFPALRVAPGNVLPISDKDGKYLGCISKAVLYEKVPEIFRLGDDGMTIELDLPSIGLKLSEVLAIFEKNDATVVSFCMYHAPEMVAAFRVQTHDFFRLVKNLEKYGYSIRYSSPIFQEKDESLREKALEFIRLMDM
ncbi:MAG: CBS domain-containing protein [Chlorobiaceae bacterium]|nr:CBS domain-containing protein [Chlorobiaceae bacterium]NTW10164.1 CBS domain-containing protein [Chlorobiaceae bacterium]